jgi:hypothetical protein
VGRVAARRRSTARTAVLPARRTLPDVARFTPSGRSILVGLAIFALAVAAYVGARETSVFAVRSIVVRGGTPQLRASVTQALAPEAGRSLLRVDEGDLDRRLAAVTGILSFRYDRAFPHTLRVVLRADPPVLVVRQLPSAYYLISASGRVLRPLAHPHLSHLPRLYVPHESTVRVGQVLPAGLSAAAAVLAALRGTPLTAPVLFVTHGPHGFALELQGGLEVRLGDDGDLRLKLAIARRILRTTAAATTRGGYLDVSVPERPVLSSHSQVGG